MISNPDTDCDPDTDPDPEDSLFLIPQFSGTHCLPERLSLSWPRGQRLQF